MEAGPARATPSKASSKKRKREDGSSAAGATPVKANGAAAAASPAPGQPAHNAAGAEDDDAAAKRLAKQARKEKKRDKKALSSAAAAGADDSVLSTSSSIGAGTSTANGKKNKSKARSSHAAHPSALSAVSGAPQSAYRVVYPVLNMPIAPIWWRQPLGAVRELFDTMVMRYVPQLNGILISHTEHSFLNSSAELRGDSAFATAPVKVKCVVWSPSIGMRLEGKIVYSNTDVVSLLLNGTFNAAIPAAHLPPNQYEFVHHQYGAEADGVGDGEDDFGAQSPGYWRNKHDGSQLGGSTGFLTFTCFGITSANQMLFLRGSLLDDPLQAKGASDSSSSPSVDARALQTLFPNVNLDFSSKEGLESGARRSAVRGANGNADAGQAAGGAGDGEAVRRRVRWFDQEDGEDADDDDADDEDGARLSFGSANAGASSAVLTASAKASLSDAEDGQAPKEGTDVEDDDEEEEAEEQDDDEDPADVSMVSAASTADVSMASSIASTSAAGKDNSEEAKKQRKAEREEKRRKKAAKAQRNAEREQRRAEKEAKKAKKHAKVKKEKGT